MRMILYFVAMVVAILSSDRPSLAEGKFVMERPKSPGVRLKVIGGQMSDPSQWPATFIFGEGDNRDCTSTVVGARVVLTAAHCVSDGASGGIDTINQQSKLTCYHHPDYTPCWPTSADGSGCPAGKSTSADYALCLSDAALSGFEFEKINVNSNLPIIGKKVLLTGFGCNQSGGSDGGFGVLFEGESDVAALPASNSDTPWLQNYIIAKGGAAICYGDSGGASYYYLDPSKVRRLLIGVNSRSDMQAGQKSYLSATSVTGFIQWAKTWANQRGVEVCGVHPSAENCRP